MLRPEPLDIVIILVIAFLIFGGANRIPETARAMGKAIREFKDALAGKDDADQTEKKQTH